jgi:capsid protein
MDQPTNNYDVVTQSSKPQGSGNLRRRARVEIEEEDQLYPSRKRALGIDLTRQAMRNLAAMRGVAKQLRINTVGPLGKLHILGDDDSSREAQTWFNGTWAKDAEFRAGLHWGEFLQLVVIGTANEGDIVSIFDDGVITGGSGSGRILAFESDQIADVDHDYFRREMPPYWKQEQGLIRDEFGREAGVCVSGKRGVSVLDPKEALILRKDPSAPKNDNFWAHIKRQWRMIQGRGAADTLSSINLLIDNAEILQRELQTAKLRAAQAGFVKPGENKISAYTDPRLDPSIPLDIESLGEEQTAPTVTGGDSTPTTQYDRLEEFTGGYMEYLEPGESVEFPSIDRPNVNLAEFLKYTQDLAGQPHGLAHAYAALSANTSYTSFQGDMAMSFMSFVDGQRWLERNVADWAAIRALNWAMQNQLIKPLPNGWQSRLAWQWPVAPQIDQVKAQKGIEMALKNGKMTYSQLIGPHWKDHFKELAEELTFIGELRDGKGLPLNLTAKQATSTEHTEEDDEDDAED